MTNNSGDFNTAYTYNLGGMVTELTTQNGDTAIQSHSYTYLPNGNISGKQSTVGTQTTNYAYQYDKAGTDGTITTYGYDGNKHPRGHNNLPAQFCWRTNFY